MSHKKLVMILLGLSIIGFVIGIVLTESVSVGICGVDERFGCIRPLYTIGQPFAIFSFALGLIFLLLLFLPKKFFDAWLKYAAWFIPVAIIWIAITSDNCQGGLGLGLCFDKELATWWASGMYVVLSLGVLLTTYIRSRHTKGRPFV